MSNIDKRALREAAEKAGTDNHTQDEWFHYLRCSTPATVLALLDEIAELEQGHCGAALLEREESHAKTVGKLLDELEAAEKLNAELIEKQRLIDICQGQGLEHRIAAEKRAEAAEKRVAELEAREVKLPKPHAHLIWIQAGRAPDDFWDDVAVSHSEKDKCCDGSERYPVYARWEIEEALSAAGIRINGEG